MGSGPFTLHTGWRVTSLVETRTAFMDILTNYLALIPVANFYGSVAVVFIFISY